MDIARTSAIGLTTSITHLILLIAPFHVLALSIGFLASSARRRAIRAFSIGEVSAWPCAVGLSASTERGSSEGKGDSGEED